MIKSETNQGKLVAENRRYVEAIAKQSLNQGLISQLLAIGDSVEVLEPLELREEIKKRISNMFNFYK
jgi:predicted DNA-binding transcriptional regulator YafY